MKRHMFQFVSRKVLLVWTLGLCVLGTSCGDIPQDVSVSDSGERQEYSYSVKFREIPDPDREIYDSDIMEGHEECQVREMERIYAGECIYRFLAIINEDEHNFYYENVLQVFREDNWEWEQIPLSGEGWIEGKVISINTLAGVSEEGVFLRITDYFAEEGAQSYLAYFDGAEGKILMEWPKEVQEACVCQDSGRNIYFADEVVGVIHASDRDGKQLWRSALDAYIRGCFCNPVTGNMIWYGNVEGELRLWEDGSRPASYEVVKAVAPYESLITCGPDGALYYADAQAIWMSGESPQQILNFGDSGYLPQELHHIRVLENGDILCYVTMDGTLCLMTLSQSADSGMSEQQEILLYGYADLFLQQIITRFNRQNTQYHITVQNPVEDSRLSVEIAGGGGPDLLFLSPLTAREYVRQGYIQEMEGIVEDPSLFLNAALENGKVDGVTYGIPCSCTLNCLVFSQEIAGDRDSWTVEEMMQAVRESGAEALYWYFSQYNAYSIVLDCGLYDNENTAYIDWEKGESHLDEPPFKELLTFAREYADSGDYDSSEVLPKLQGGEIAGLELHLWRPGLLDYADTFFEGKASYVGYPTSTGKKGVYVRADCLYVNQATDQLEGVREFLRFMLTEEAQKLCVAGGESFILPVRLDAIYHLVELDQGKEENPCTYEDGYVIWQEDGLDQEQLKTLEKLLEQAQPYKFNAMELGSIMEEELAPYFSGDRSLEKTVEILDSRIQIYLDERGPRP